MHRLPSDSTVKRIRLISLLVCAKCLMTPAAVGMLLCAFTITNFKLALIGSALLGMTGMLVMMQWMLAMRVKCPLCMTPVLGNRECAKHRNALTFLGSHRLRVAISVLCLNHFRCPYCGEYCEVKSRARRPH